MFRRRCAMALSLLLTLSSTFPASVFAKTLAEQNKMLVQEEEELVGAEEKTEAEDSGSSKLFQTLGDREVSFYQSEIVDGISVTVTADVGVFPEDAKLRVKKPSKATEKKVESAVGEKLEEDQDLAHSLVLDISILNAKGEELQPDTDKGEVKVQFEQLNFFNEEGNQELAVYHLNEPDAEVEKLEGLKIDWESKSLEISANHFSLFVISLIDKKRANSSSIALELGSSHNVKELFNNSESNRFFYSVKEIKSLNEDILAVEKRGTEYFITGKKAGSGRIEIKSMDESIRYLDFIVQNAIYSGRIGKNIDYILTGKDNNLTLTIRGYGDTDFRETAPWQVFRNQISTVVLEEGIQNFRISRAFKEMPNLKTVSLPSTLNYIPLEAFYQSNQLGDVTIPASVKEIESRAFVKTAGNKNKIKNLSSCKLKNQDEIEDQMSHYDSRYSIVEQSQEADSNKIISFEFEGLKLWTFQGKTAFLELSSLLSRKSGSYSTADIDYYLYRTDNPAEQVEEGTFKNAEGVWNIDLAMSGNKSILNLSDGNKMVQRELQYDRRLDLSTWEVGKSYYCYILAIIKEEGKEKYRKVSPAFTVALANATELSAQEGDITWSIRPKNPGEFKEPFVLTIGGQGEILDSEGKNGDRPWLKLLKAMNYPAIYLELQEGITRVGDENFSDAKIMGDLNLPDSIKSIGGNAFLMAVIEGDIRFPKNLKSIEYSAFDGIFYTGDINLPEGLEEIGSGAFYGRRSGSGSTYTPVGTEEKLIPHSSIGTITIPSTVRRIADAAFYKEDMGINGKNKIINHSSVKLSDRHANPLFTDFALDNSGEESIIKPKSKNTGSSSSGSHGGGGGGGSSHSGGNSSYSGGSKPIVNQDSKPKEGSDKADWQKDSKGWWVKNDDGSYPKDEWKKINNNWYFFNKEGYMSTGWVQIKDAWYYLDNTDTENGGKMNTGWKYIGEQWYYFGIEEGEMQGKMSTGWKYISGKWYYLNPEAGANNGKMLFNTVVDGYTLGPDGAWDNQPKKAG